jgi:acetylornithine/succinyldiaminopimelate/putrescine aminotransferase
VLRLAPPLVVGEDEVEHAVSVSAEAVTVMEAAARK